MLWLGIGEISKITVISLAVFFPIAYNTYTGVSQTNRLLINVAITFGATKLDLIRKVIFPSALPMIFAGMRISAGVSLLILVSAEMIAAQHGSAHLFSKMQTYLLSKSVSRGIGSLYYWWSVQFCTSPIRKEISTLEIIEEWSWQVYEKMVVC